MTAALEHHAPAVPAPAAPLTAAAIMAEGRCAHVDAFSRLAIAAVLRARRFVLSHQAQELIALLPLARWSHAVAWQALSPADPPVWVERGLRPGDLPLLPDAIGGVGALLMPPPRPGAYRGNAAVLGVACRSGVTDRTMCEAVSHVCPLHRGSAVADLVAAVPLLLAGVLKAVPIPAAIPGQVGADWLIVAVGSGVA